MAPPRATGAWDRAALEAREGWRLTVPARAAAEVMALCRHHPEVLEDVTRLDGLDEPMPALGALGRRVREALLLGDGVVWMRGLGKLALTAAEQKTFHAALGSALGRPMDEYGRLYEVRDRGVSYETQAVPVSMTRAGTGFHTDSSRRDCVPDFVGLLCERPAARGGESLVSDARAAYAALQAEEPWALATLERPLVRDLVTPGVERSEAALLANRFPVFAPSERPEGLLFRYMRYWIEKGQAKAGAPLDGGELAALDALDRRLADPENVAGFRLDAGDILWVSNRFVAHNRAGYEDDPDRPRLLHRMWIDAGITPAR